VAVASWLHLRSEDKIKKKRKLARRRDPFLHPAQRLVITVR